MVYFLDFPSQSPYYVITYDPPLWFIFLCFIFSEQLLIYFWNFKNIPYRKQKLSVSLSK